MHLPPLQSPFTASYHASGDVAIAPDAVIAPGVVLMADPRSQIVIGAGACLGLGVVLHAHQGSIVVEAGASLGAGVLGVGNFRIGTHACVGASTTLHNVSIAPGQLVPPGSLLGDVGRGSSAASGSVHASTQPCPSTSDHSQAEPSPWDDGSVGAETAPYSESTTSSKAPKMEEESQNVATTPDSNRSNSASGDSPRRPKKVYGKDQFERMRTLFMPNDQTV